jgi:hypothetical protein
MNLNRKKTPVTNPLPASAPPPTREQIAALAHAIWLDRGQPHGCDIEHWLEAERQLGLRSAAGARGESVDPDTAPAGTIDRELGRIVAPPGPRSPTSL